MNRREFIKGAAAVSAMAATPSSGAAPAAARTDFRWAMLVHFGMKWCGELPRRRTVGGKPQGYLNGHLTQEEYDLICSEPYWTHEKLRFDEGLWREYAAKLRECGCNELVIDLAEFMRFPSHPELAVPDSWSPDRLAAEVGRLKGMGFALVPKLNFSCCHNGWMGIYRRMVGTPKYYEVCRDVIRDTMAVFKDSKTFHLGMDEEQETKYQTADNDLIVMRNNRLWWHDCNFLFDEVRRHGCQPWMWSNTARSLGIKEYSANVPKDVVASAWVYYHADYRWNPKVTKAQIAEGNRGRLERYRTMLENLANAGYEIMPCVSHCYGDPQGCYDVLELTKRIVPAERFRGMAMTTWMSTLPAYRRRLFEGADIIARMKAACV